MLGHTVGIDKDSSAELTMRIDESKLRITYMWAFHVEILKIWASDYSNAATLIFSGSDR